MLSAAQRQNLLKRFGAKKFGVPGKAPGGGSYPMPDASHARNALARAAQSGNPRVIAQVKAKVRQNYPTMSVK